MLYFHNTLIRSMKSGKQTDFIYTNFNETFNSVSHSVLIKKLGVFCIKISLKISLKNWRYWIPWTYSKKVYTLIAYSRKLHVIDSSATISLSTIQISLNLDSLDSRYKSIDICFIHKLKKCVIFYPGFLFTFFKF